MAEPAPHASATAPRAPLREETTRHLHRTAVDRQRTGRVPGLVAAVSHGGSLLWSDGVGVADVGGGAAPGPDHQYLIASNTKTFTAVMVMQLRDEGRLSLDDALGDHVPGVGHAVTVRQCLAHVSGMAREPLGDVWETLEQPDDATLRRDFARLERVGRPHDRWHYSNVVYAMLGQLVAELDGRSWAEALRARLLDPLGMTRTTVGFGDGPRATGYVVPPWDDVPREEPFVPLRAMDPCGGLASTAEDLARWSRFVADPEPLLAADTLEEMCQPQALVLPDATWQAAMGLGFFLLRRGEHTWVGHTGGMPGHVTALFTHRASGTGGIALMNTSSAPDPAALAIDLADHVVEHDPAEPEPWRPGTEVPEHLRPLLGVWYSESHPFRFYVEQGVLKARLDVAGATDAPPSVFERTDDDAYRTVSGRERGERLRVTRRADGSVRQLNWATYLFSREPLPFGERPD